jgi:hypothetical protein
MQKGGLLRIGFCVNREDLKQYMYMAYSRHMPRRIAFLPISSVWVASQGFICLGTDKRSTLFTTTSKAIIP